MSYEPTIWRTGDTVTAEKLNKIEQAIVADNTAIEGKVGRDEFDTEIATLESKVGSPLIASTVSEMTETDRVYVYTGSETGYTSGNWYYYDGTVWTSGGVYNAVAIETDTTLSVSGKAADAKKVGDELADVKEDLTQLSEDATNDIAGLDNDLERLSHESVKVKNSDETSSDFDVSDEDGYVLVRFKDGEIETKNFNSRKAVKILDSLTDDPDFDISDESGNVILRLQNGDAKTKYFDSSLLRNVSAIYSATSTATTITVDVNLKKGDKIIIKVDDGVAYWRWGNYITYKAGNKTILNNEQMSNRLFAYTVGEDCDTITMIYGQADYTPSANKTVTVYKLGLIPITPTIVTVKKDGTGDFTTIRAAVDYVTARDHSAELNPYEIHVYPGTYDVLSDYTEAEIREGNDGGSYTQTSFSGVKLLDGMSMVGIGNRDDIIIYGVLSTSTYASSVRNNISTLNMQGSGDLRNLTVVSENIRYCVHDDFTSGYGGVDIRHVIGCKFIGKNFPNNADSTYGAGMVAPRMMYFKDCDFGRNCGVHTVYNSRGMRIGVTVVCENCKGLGFRIGDRVHASTNPVNTFIFNNCDFQFIEIYRPSTDVQEQHSRVTGIGNTDTMFIGENYDFYSYGNIILLPPTSLSRGKVVDISGTLTTSVSSAYGICIGVDSDYAYVQYSGYINTNLLGVSNFAIGDYITVDSSSNVVSGGDSSASLGRCVYVDGNGIGQYKLNMIGG